MKTIYKYALDESTIMFDISMPAEGKILHVGLDPRGVPCIWAEVETEKQLETRHFEIMGTGQEFPDDARERNHVGTFLQPSFGFVWHLYEVTIPAEDGGEVTNKEKKVHYGWRSSTTPACGRWWQSVALTTEHNKTTCKNCLRTALFKGAVI